MSVPVQTKRLRFCTLVNENSWTPCICIIKEKKKSDLWFIRIGSSSFLISDLNWSVRIFFWHWRFSTDDVLLFLHSQATLRNPARVTTPTKLGRVVAALIRSHFSVRPCQCVRAGDARVDEPLDVCAMMTLFVRLGVLTHAKASRRKPLSEFGCHKGANVLNWPACVERTIATPMGKCQGQESGVLNNSSRLAATVFIGTTSLCSCPAVVVLRSEKRWQTCDFSNSREVWDSHCSI